MQIIPSHLVTSWAANNNFVTPSGVRMRCGHCKVHGLFLFKFVAQTSDLLSWCATSECPACSKTTRFFAIVPLSSNVNNPETILYADPAPSFERLPINGVDLAPEELQTAYYDALETFNSSAPNSAVLNQCRQALEAIALAAVPNSKSKSLANLLNELPANVDLGRPFLDIAAALRHAGNMGSHYKVGRRIPDELRGEMMDMLDQLLEYLFIIPKQVSETRQRISQVDTGVQSDAIDDKT